MTDQTLLSALLIFLASWWASVGFADERPNVLLLVSDDQRPDTIHELGNDLIRTPNLDQLVREGCAFTRATCANPICTPSRAEILTGCTSFRNGVHDFGRKIDPDVPLMARWFGDAGYDTWYVGKWHNDGAPTERGYERTNGLYRGGGGNWYKPQTDWTGRPVTGYRGWLFQSDDGTKFPERGVGLTPDISGLFADAAIELIKTPTDKPFFLHVNFTAPHDPLFLPTEYRDAYDPKKIPLPANFLAEHPFDHGNFAGRDEKLFRWPRTQDETRGELAAYYSVISHMDEQIGRIVKSIDEAGKLENTLIVFASDHGLGVGSHGLRGKQSMYEHTIGVPLLMRGPGIPAGRRLKAECVLRDLFPTLCALTGVAEPGTRVDGLSLKPVIDGQTEQIRPFVVGYFRSFQRMIRTPMWKFIEYPEVGRQQLFDLQADPNELRNLIDDPGSRKVTDKLKQQLRMWQKANDDPIGS